MDHLHQLTANRNIQHFPRHAPFVFILLAEVAGNGGDGGFDSTCTLAIRHDAVQSSCTLYCLLRFHVATRQPEYKTNNLYQFVLSTWAGKNNRRTKITSAS